VSSDIRYEVFDDRVPLGGTRSGQGGLAQLVPAAGVACQVNVDSGDR
jgi:hypothetical protein